MSPTALLAAPATQTEKTNNFLIPNATFIVEVLVFLVILWFLYKKVLPRIYAMLEARLETIRLQFEEAKKARESAEKAQKEYTDALAETRKEISRLREEAQSEGAQILEEYRQRAQREFEERMQALDERLATERLQVMMALRNELGELAFTLSEKIVRDSLREDERQRKLVDDFIAGVGATVHVEAEATS
ncbi:MAG: F-type H+-transporting ATPase subunit b [Frankiaceae bacterium]|nr:F-type H+-transporting ATPase subunit b [Frankiaceae bacterium]